ncbi:MAG: PIN domain-containing protein [Nostocoides sp.]
MNRRVVLDACVLVPINLASPLLTLAERDLLEPRWSAEILDEASRALITKIGLRQEAAIRRRDAMELAFPEAEVAVFEVHVEGLECHPKDRHVLAAAIASDADVIVTFNLRDFPDAACEPHGIVAMDPEESLLRLLASDREKTLTAVVADAARRTNPSASAAELLARLAATVPTFANLAHQGLQEAGPFSDIPAYVVADLADSPLAALSGNPDFKEPLHVAALGWLAVLTPDRYGEQLRWLTREPEALGRLPMGQRTPEREVHRFEGALGRR